jgi:hypothetical protein
MKSASTACESASSKKESSEDSSNSDMEDTEQEPLNEFNDPAAGGFVDSSVNHYYPEHNNIENDD